MRLTYRKRLTLNLASLFLFSLFFISCSTEEVSEEIGFSEDDIEAAANSKHALSGYVTNNGWADSFSVWENGKNKCYCKSTYDHHIGGYNYAGKKVRRICENMKADMWKALNRVGWKVTWYNTVNCGHWPWHNDNTINGQKDEVLCPGRVGNGIRCNSQKGPVWDRKYIY